MRSAHVARIRNLLLREDFICDTPVATNISSQLLALMGIGFLQGLYALDAADGQTREAYEVSQLCLWNISHLTLLTQVVNVLVQALLQYVNNFSNSFSVTHSHLELLIMRRSNQGIYSCYYQGDIR